MTHIKLDNVSLSYPIFEKVRIPSPQSSLGGDVYFDKNQAYIKALDNISLEVKSGMNVGILGHNGAGKSSLLRVIANIYKPTKGEVSINGDVNAVFDKMLGMDPELTGRENIRFRCLFNNLSRKDYDKVIDEIVEFSLLHEFIDLPIKYYSPGMKSRLGFAISTSFSSDILLLDEWLGVGDAEFQKQASFRMDEFKNRSSIFVLASHNEKLISRNCDVLYVMEKGKLIDVK